MLQMRAQIHVGLYVKHLLISCIPIETNIEVDREMFIKISPSHI
jgi:hypothetical protein